jgi:hypothetical protein
LLVERLGDEQQASEGEDENTGSDGLDWTEHGLGPPLRAFCLGGSRDSHGIDRERWPAFLLDFMFELMLEGGLVIHR